MSLGPQLDPAKVMPWYFICLGAPSIICTAVLVIASLYALLTYFFGDDQRKRMSLGFLIISDMLLISIGHILMHYLLAEALDSRSLEVVLSVGLAVFNVANLLFVKPKMNKLK